MDFESITWAYKMMILLTWGRLLSATKYSQPATLLVLHFLIRFAISDCGADNPFVGMENKFDSMLGCAYWKPLMLLLPIIKISSNLTVLIATKYEQTSSTWWSLRGNETCNKISKWKRKQEEKCIVVVCAVRELRLRWETISESNCWSNHQTVSSSPSSRNATIWAVNFVNFWTNRGWSTFCGKHCENVTFA